ncbi:MAG: acyltransferase [Candidatus Omnitrophica bacterium]|nr:acyltransferase [Candidatus Omnitrophota bacterium]
MSAYNAFLNTKYFGSLNGIRALAIMCVIGYHFACNCRALGINDFIPGPVFERGFLGVNLFFIVSGFLITTLLLREQRSYQTISIRSFYERRIRRIFPLYYTVLVVTVFILPFTASSLAAKKEFIDNLPFFFTYTSNWFVFNNAAIFGIAWTLATEEQFYLVWPHILKVFTIPITVSIVILMIMLNQLAIFEWISFLPLLSARLNSFLLIVLISISTPICLGALLAFGLNSKTVYEKVSIFKSEMASPILLVIVLGCVFVPEQLTHSMIGVINFLMTLFVGSCVYQEKHSLVKILKSRLFFHMGLVSYGMYLFHIHCLYVVRHVFLYLNWKNTNVEFVACVVMTLALAHLSFYFFESRFRGVKDNALIVRLEGMRPKARAGGC